MEDEAPSLTQRAKLPTASDYQVRIFEAVETAVSQMLDGQTPASMIIEAKPGSGKTTTGVAATRLIPDEISTIFVAFNKKIVTELESRLPRGVPAKTFHSHWLRQWGEFCWHRYRSKVTINDFKMRDAVNKHFGFSRFKKSTRRKSEAEVEQEKKQRELADEVAFFVEKAKVFGVVPQGYPGAECVTGFSDNDYFWQYIMGYFNHFVDDKIVGEAIEIAREILWDGLDNELEVDFHDMLYMPAVKQIAGDTYQVVMIDEAQDLNGLQRYLLTRMVEPGGMIIAIGDKRQSIYAFRGADVESMDNIKAAFDCREYPLSISYRCARKIVEVAYEIYPEIEASPDAPEGSVEHPETLKIDAFEPGHLIVCRNNAPTTDLAYKLICHKIPAKVLGRDIGEGLMKLVRKLDEDNTLPTLMEGLRAWRERQIALVDRKDPDDQKSKDVIEDKYKCIRNLAQSPDILDVKQLLAVIDQMFTSAAEEKQAVSPSRVTLSTIHKIKGAEADTVFILDPHLINPPWVKSDWQAVQEENLRFVAVTRAKSRLVFIASKDIRE
jgi:DNA helicase-2/ATP-dependent DNA helicase PcrA